MTAYADTSFVVSLYVADSNSRRALELLKQIKPPLLLTSIGELEFVNAFCLRLFRREITAHQLKTADELFVADCARGVFQVTTVSDSLYEAAKQIARRRTAQIGTRAIDILHVAAALSLHADTFYTFDRNQKKLADAEGLSVP